MRVVAKDLRCAPHRTGVSPGMPPFYLAGCEVCEAKRARGAVTGQEPPPVSLRGAWWRGRCLRGNQVRAR